MRNMFLTIRVILLIVFMVIGSILFSTQPVLAIPVAGEYTLSSTVLNGTFTSNGASVTDWDFMTTPDNLNFFNLTPGTVVSVNIPDIFEHDIDDGTGFGIPPAIRIDWNGTLTTPILVTYFPPVGQKFDDFAVAAPVPIPSTILLFGIGFAGFAAWRKRADKQPLQ